MTHSNPAVNRTAKRRFCVRCWLPSALREPTAETMELTSPLKNCLYILRCRNQKIKYHKITQLKLCLPRFLCS